MKHVLILGKSSYIGESLFNWLQRFDSDYQVDIVSTMNYEWKKADFAKYDVVVNFTGIAHINNITEDMRGVFYSVNRDLVVEMGRYAKEYGVKHYIQFSSMNVYGDYCQCVTDRTHEAPTSFYGDSKLQGDIGLRKLEDNNFIVACVRPPFVYGKGCKGNYNTISRIARKIPVFPTYRNRKSMIYIDNLCEFIRLLIDSGEGGCFTPQNKELVSTTDLVQEIAACHQKKVLFTGLFNWMISVCNKLTSQIRRAFADDCYDPKLSDHFGYEYCVVGFADSIKRTEQ